jgi:transposase
LHKYGIINAVIKMAAVKRRYELSDEEWERIKDLLPSDKLEKQGRPPKPNRDMLNAILWIARSGAAWRDMPERYGPWETVYTRFKKWSEQHVFEEIFSILSIDADYQDLSLDSTSIKAHEHSAGAKKGQ